MGRVELYDDAHPERFNKSIALIEEVQDALDYYTMQLAERAIAELMNKGAHPYSEGRSYITIGKGRVDRAVILNDPDQNNGRGSAEWAIEKGTKRSRGISALLDEVL